MQFADEVVPVIWKSYPVMEETSNYAIIYLTELRRYGYLITLNAFVSRVVYVDEFGTVIDTYVENDEFEVWEEPFTYEHE